MRLVELEAKLKKAREMGAQDDTLIGLACDTRVVPGDDIQIVLYQLSPRESLWLQEPDAVLCGEAEV